MYFIVIVIVITEEKTNKKKFKKYNNTSNNLVSLYNEISMNLLWALLSKDVVKELGYHCLPKIIQGINIKPLK